MSPLSTAPISRQTAIAIESAEIEAWRDMYAAMPAAYRQAHRPELIDLDGVVLTRCRAMPFVHFNAVLNLGLEAPAARSDVDALCAAYAAANVNRFTIFHHRFCAPGDLVDWLPACGFQPRPGWDRIYRPASAAVALPRHEAEVAFVTARTAPAWGRFLERWYGVPTLPWLTALVERTGWVHAVLVREDEIVAARSMFFHAGHFAWLGVEAPVPGIMAPSFDDDRCVVRALVAEGLRREAQLFVTDVEAPNSTLAGPSYDRWEELGFAFAYHRKHYVRG